MFLTEVNIQQDEIDVLWLIKNQFESLVAEINDMELYLCTMTKRLAKLVALFTFGTV